MNRFVTQQQYMCLNAFRPKKPDGADYELLRA
jgi:hypothetical protein